MREEVENGQSESRSVTQIGQKGGGEYSEGGVGGLLRSKRLENIQMGGWEGVSATLEKLSIANL